MPLTPAEGGPEVREREELSAVLVVAARSAGLDGDVAAMGLTWEDLGGGYLRVHDGLFTLYVVELDVAGLAEGDDLLHSFGHGTLRSPEARWFWMERVGSKEAAMNMQDMEGYKELMDKMLDTLPAEQVLSHYAPEEVLSHYAPEQRLVGLDRDHQALALPVEVLRLLPEAYLRSLSPEAEAEIRRRLRQNSR
ncbi:MAG TPA: hypothetical protein VHN14_31105 [Kofleriaceae bacterium]|jgi:hypothetical protein|nr:hypothetical protein [Kofleriaceae bacterium]